MAASLDGYIASASGGLDWLNNSMVRGEDYGFSETMKRTGASIVPVLLGGGVHFFGKLSEWKRFILAGVKQFERLGILLLTYRLAGSKSG